MRIEGNLPPTPQGSGRTDASDGGSFSDLAERIGGATDSSKSETRYYLELQKKIQAESRFFQTVSNILKARHDSAMAAIRNLR